MSMPACAGRRLSADERTAGQSATLRPSSCASPNAACARSAHCMHALTMPQGNPRAGRGAAASALQGGLHAGVHAGEWGVPMPKATVATTTSSSSRRKRSCTPACARPRPQPALLFAPALSHGDTCQQNAPEAGARLVGRGGVVVPDPPSEAVLLRTPARTPPRSALRDWLGTLMRLARRAAASQRRAARARARASRTCATFSASPRVMVYTMVGSAGPPARRAPISSPRLVATSALPRCRTASSKLERSKDVTHLRARARPRDQLGSADTHGLMLFRDVHPFRDEHVDLPACWAVCTLQERPARPGRGAQSAQAGSSSARWGRGAPAVPRPQAQGGSDVVAHARRGGCGQRHERHAGQRLPQLAQPPAARQGVSRSVAGRARIAPLSPTPGGNRAGQASLRGASAEGPGSHLYSSLKSWPPARRPGSAPSTATGVLRSGAGEPGHAFGTRRVQYRAGRHKPAVSPWHTGAASGIAGARRQQALGAAHSLTQCASSTATRHSPARARSCCSRCAAFAASSGVM